MKIKIKSLGLSILTSLALVTACQSVSQLYPKSHLLQREGTSADLSYSSATAISGKVEFPTNSPLLLPSLTKRGDGGEFSLKATQTEISKQATVSLIYPSDHPSLPNVTIAAGPTDASGNFTVKPGTSFSPAVNSVYVLEANRRLGGNGNSLLSLRTYLQWNGTGWSSMTTSGIYINTNTTALAIIQENLKNRISSAQTIGKIDTSGGTSVPQSIGSIDKILFSSMRDGNYEIYSMNSDGTAQTRLTVNPLKVNNYPVFSKDNSRIAFMSNRDGNNEIYVMNPEGLNQTRLTNNSADDSTPSFSPDGNKIIFSSNRTGSYQIYKMDSVDINPDGNGENQINLSQNGFNDRMPVYSPDGSKIAFVSGRDGNNEIYMMNSDGTNLKNLTNNAGDDSNPFFSSDGTKLIFQTNKDGNYEIYSMNIDGSSQSSLTNNSASDKSPTLSSDGTKIIFQTDRDGNNEIYSMGIDGSSPNRITNNSVADENPNSSVFVKAQIITNVAALVNNILLNNQDPMGYVKYNNGVFKIVEPPTRLGQIVFASMRDGNYEIYSMNADGTLQARLTNSPTDDYNPSWSPDKRKIVFQTDRDGNSEIYTMNPDGSEQSRLTNNSAFEADASFSPDGSKIVFISNRDGNVGIYSMNLDGTNINRLTNNSGNDERPKFSADGSKIVFSSYRDGNYEIYSMNPDGSAQTRLTNNSVGDFNPSYSPDGTKIVFTSTRDGNWEIYTMSSGGSGTPNRLTNNPNGDEDPSFSVDGKIVFESIRDGNVYSEIYTMNSDGTNLTRLTNNSSTDVTPNWR